MDPAQRPRLVGVVAIAALVSGGLVLFRTGAEPPPDVPPAAIPVYGAPDSPGPTVHVSGAVTEPGLVVLSPGARVADALAAAGGSTFEADLSSLNLAAQVRDGERIVVPAAADAESGRLPAEATDGRIRINTATAGELEALPGVGPVLAQRIVEFRDLHGPFAEVEDLLDVPGIGEAKLATLREAVVLQ